MYADSAQEIDIKMKQDKTAEAREKILKGINLNKFYTQEQLDLLSESIDKAISEGMKLEREEERKEQLRNPTIFGQPLKEYEEYIKTKTKEEAIREIFLELEKLNVKGKVKHYIIKQKNGKKIRTGKFTTSIQKKGHVKITNIRKLNSELLEKIRKEET